MGIVGGMDVHRQQLTFDYVDTETGRLERGKITHADRERLAGWLRRFEGVGPVTFATEAGTGWRYVAQEMRRVGIEVQLAEPADTAAARGPKRRAKTDRADAQLLRELCLDGRVPQCYIPPDAVLEFRALLELYHDLRAEHTAWVQRVHAVCFHQGAPAPGEAGVISAAARARLDQVASTHLSAAGQRQVTVATAMMSTLEEHLDRLRRDLVRGSRHLRGARVLQDTIYGVGPLTGLALCCWLGGADRFSASRKAVRFAGLDITVRSSDAKRAPGRLSRQGPAVLRWFLYEAGKTSSRPTAPDYAYYTHVKERIDGKRAALAQARRILRQASHILTDLGDDAFTTT
jgi:transposase